VHKLVWVVLGSLFLLSSCSGSGENPWKEFWAWFYGDYIFHALMTVGVLLVVFFPGKIFKWLSKIKRVKAGVGGVELETVDSSIDPATPCPYTKSRDEAFASLKDLDVKVGNLEQRTEDILKAINDVLNKINNMSIDQQKQIFYDTDQPTEDRMAGGLRYVHQGGNHQTKPKVIVYAREHPDLYLMIIKMVPELKLEDF
jgi:hypothetical protein